MSNIPNMPRDLGGYESLLDRYYENSEAGSVSGRSEEPNESEGNRPSSARSSASIEPFYYDNHAETNEGESNRPSSVRSSASIELPPFYFDQHAGRLPSAIFPESIELPSSYLDEHAGTNEGESSPHSSAMLPESQTLPLDDEALQLLNAAGQTAQAARPRGQNRRALPPAGPGVSEEEQPTAVARNTGRKLGGALTSTRNLLPKSPKPPDAPNE